MIGNADSALGKTALIKGVGDLYEKHFGLIADTVVIRQRLSLWSNGPRTSDDRFLMSGDKPRPSRWLGKEYRTAAPATQQGAFGQRH